MTYIEKLKIEHPDRVNEGYVGGCSGCPGDFWKGAPSYRMGCGPNACASCWDQTVPGTENISGNDVTDFIKNLAKGIRIAFGGDGRVVPEIKKVIFNDPATIIFWADGTKTVVKATNESYDPEKGLAMAISRKALGNTGSYYNEFDKWLDAYKAKTTTFELKLPTCQEAIDALKQLGEKLKKGGIQ